jgi:large subunit ribosomal protein L17
MNKKVFGRKLGRDKNERAALFKNLMSALIMFEKIETSESKAKAIRPEIEKLITKAKSSKVSDKTVLEKNLTRTAFEKMVKEIGPRFAKRQGGYTRMIKIGKRFGDDSPTVIMELVDKISAVAVIAPKAEKKTSAAKSSKAGLKEAKPAKKTAVKKDVKPVKKKSPSSRKATKGK